MPTTPYILRARAVRLHSLTVVLETPQGILMLCVILYNSYMVLPTTLAQAGVCLQVAALTRRCLVAAPAASCPTRPAAADQGASMRHTRGEHHGVSARASITASEFVIGLE